MIAAALVYLVRGGGNRALPDPGGGSEMGSDLDLGFDPVVWSCRSTKTRNGGS